MLTGSNSGSAKRLASRDFAEPSVTAALAPCARRPRSRSASFGNEHAGQTAEVCVVTSLACAIFAMAAAGTWHGSRNGEPTASTATVLVSVVEWFGELGSFTIRIFRAAILPPYEFRELIRQCDAVGSKSLPLVCLAGAPTGVVLSLETHDSLVRFGAKSFLPAVIVFSILRESGPIIAGLVLSGRVGAGIGAELGSMKVTEQIDAMEASAVDPYKYLAATRVVACVVTLPLLTVAADFCGILMGWVANTLTEPIS